MAARSSVRSSSLIAGSLIALVAVACTGKVPPTSPATDPAPSARSTHPVEATDAPVASAPRIDSSPDAWLVVGHPGDDGLEVILASTNERLYTLPTGIPDKAWGHLIDATIHGTSTVVQDLTVQPGFDSRSQTIDGAWRLPTIGPDPTPVGLSANGSTIVLVEAGTDPGTTGVSRFAILRSTFDHDPTIVRLPGSFEYDAMSGNGSTLYVIEHLPAPPANHYQVRAVDTATGVMRPEVVVDKAELDEAMGGYPLAQVRRPDGMVFTLYRGAEHPFIHALSTIDAWALCIDLPATGADDATAAQDWGLAARPDGTIVAVNATLGLAVQVSAADLAVTRSTTFAPVASAAISLAKFGHQTAGPVGRRLVVSPGGSTLYAAGAGGIVAIAASDLRVTGRFLQGSAIDALAVTPDSNTIYALVHSGGRIVKIDAWSGAVHGQVPGDGFDRLLAVIPW